MKLNEKIAYMIGLWKMRRTKEGVGIVGPMKVQERFIKAAIDLGIPPKKIKVEKNRVVFHHIKMKNFFEKVVANLHDLLRPRKFAAAYLRGLWESTGSGRCLEGTFADQMLIERLGIYTRKEGKRIRIINFDKFADFISISSGNERDPRP